jgi:sugar/nucleoside kinase (ribokinase family)
MGNVCELLVLGHISKDINITPESWEESVGGAVVYSSIAAKRAGADIAAITKAHPDDAGALEVFRRFEVPITLRPSGATTSIRNTYHTADRERRTCEALGMAAPFEIDDLPAEMGAEIYYMGGLMKGEFPEDFVLAVAQRGKVAVDVQGFVRVNDGGAMVYRDWDRKLEVIPAVHYLKTDAAEAEILTGETDREKAAWRLAEWGAREVVLTHNTEVLVWADGRVYRAPFTPRNLSGRTGRGDTCFASYCAWRKRHTPEEACLFAAALTSLKMEKPGPFSGTLDTVNEALRERYAR